jgi:hypothetical protein
VEDLFYAVEGVAGEPDEFGAAEAEGSDVFELVAEGGGGDAFGEPDVMGAVVYLAGYMGLREIFPDELEHEELVEVGIEE